MRTSILILALAALFLAVEPASGQYHENQVLQKSFERTDFFFRPGWMNPFGLGSLGSSAAGFLRDPLVELQLGPSRVGADSMDSDLVYLDFRSTREYRSGGDVYPLYRAELDAPDMRAYPYPSYYRETRRVTEPVIATALFVRPAASALPGLTVGLTYEAIVDDQEYYRVPQDVYRSVPGADFTGERVADASMPIFDVYGGEDGMHTVGHFPTLYAGLGVAGGWRIGARASFVVFDRNGSVGSTWNDSYGPDDRISSSRNLEERDQRYRARDLSLGVERAFGSGFLAGVSAGYLDGNARQTLVRSDTASYAWGDPGAVLGGWSRYEDGGATDGRWREDGGTTHGSVFLRRSLGDGRVISATYRLERRSVDLEVASAVRDSSMSIHRQRNDENYWYSDYSSRLLDDRIGSGERTGTTHRGSLAMEWQLNPGSRLVVGAVLSVDRSETITSESVDAYRSYSHRYEYDSTVDERSERIVEDKTLDWDFRARRTAVRVPVVFSHRFNDRVEIMAGITREMAEWRIEDETVARFRLRSSTVNGRTTVRANYGERYREPVEQRTDVDTDLLIGLTVHPAESFDVRLLVMPSWYDDAWGSRVREYRWWLGLTFRP